MFGYRPRKAFSLVMLADVPLEARSQSRRLHFFSVDLLCTWRDQACAVRMRDAFMNGFLLDIIDRLSTQKKQSRQAAVASLATFETINCLPETGHYVAVHVYPRR